MIKQSARIVVIDNDENHLKSLTDVFSGMGSACLPFHYNEAQPEAHLLTDARFIFCDLHLISDALTSDKKTQYSNIVSMLLEKIDEDHGPYVLVIWSEFPSEVKELEIYIKELEPGQRPLKCCVLDKNKFISTESCPAPKTASLASAVEGLFNDIPGLSALLDWEQKVMSAASATTSTLWKLCDGNTEIKQDIALRNTLGKLAKGASGSWTAKEYPGRGVVEALTPLLADQIEKGKIDEGFWKNAVVFDKPETALSGADLYSMLHFEVPSSHSSLERGALCELSKEWSGDDHFKTKFGYTKEEILSDFVAKNKVEYAKENAKWYLLQINAACDQAQENPGLIPYVLTCIVPDNISKQKVKETVWKSRELKLEDEAIFMNCHSRFVIGLTEKDVMNFKVKLRIRNQLLDKLVQHLRMKPSRLGVIEPY